jgi:pimeloyl-ACP methyl ester carboxylesterase
MARYLDVLGHSTWIQDDGGDRRPLLMLHGGLLGSEASWGSLPPLLAPWRRLIMFDRRGHGRTSDSPEPFHYDTMAREVAAVIERLDLGPVDVVGYSDGAIVLLHLGRDRPELVSAMALISANFRADAISPPMLSALEGVVNPESRPATAYAAVSPDAADHWPVVARKTLTMIATEPTFDPSDLGAITAPTLVLASDDDFWPTGHTIDLYDALPDAQLAIVPNSSHMLVFEQPDLVAQLLTAFFDHPGRAATLRPNRRQPAGS